MIEENNRRHKIPRRKSYKKQMIINQNRLEIDSYSEDLTETKYMRKENNF